MSVRQYRRNRARAERRAAFAFIGYATMFFGFIAGAFFFCWLCVQADFGILDIAEFKSDSFLSAQEFCTYLFAWMSLSCMAAAFGTLKIIESRG